MGLIGDIMRPYTRTDRLRKDVMPLPFSAAAISLHTDKNLHIILRNLACFAGKEFFIIGADTWTKGATNGLEEFIKIRYFKDETLFFQYIKNTNYSLIAIEQSDKSIMISDVKKYPKNPLFIFGNESFGLGDNILLNSNLIIEIPNPGWHPCLNVGVSSGIVFYDFMTKTKHL